MGRLRAGVVRCRCSRCPRDSRLRGSSLSLTTGPDAEVTGIFWQMKWTRCSITGQTVNYLFNLTIACVTRTCLGPTRSQGLAFEGRPKERGLHFHDIHFWLGG